ncbi:MAG: ABC transporter substrate-binding protein [Actinomycetota bacterium]
MAAVLAVMALLLGGCQAPTGSDSGGGGETGEFHGAYPYLMPPQGHFNSFVTNTIMGPDTIYWELLEMPMGMYKWAEDDYMPLLATEWGFKPPDQFEVTLREGVKWSDGSDFTAQDVITTFTLLRVQDQIMWDYLESVEAEDDYHLTFTMKDPSTVVERYVLREGIRADSVYGRFAQDAQALFDKGASVDSKPMRKLRTQLEEFRPEEMVVTGPFQVDQESITESQLEMTKVDSAWNADTVKFDKIVVFNGETPAVTPIVLSENIDYATHGFPIATERSFEDKGFSILRPPTYFGPALYFNYDQIEAVADPRVRQAITMAIDREENGTVSLAQSAKPSEYMTGVPDGVIERWLPAEVLQDMEPYPYDPDAAAKMLEDLGFTKEGGVWTSPDGEPMDFELNAPAEFADWSAAAENLAQQLTDFGIKTTLRTVTFTQYETLISDGRFEMAIQAWGQGNPHPHFSWVVPLMTYNVQASGGGMHYSLKQETESVGSVDLERLILDSASGLNEKEQTESITSVARAFNELLPVIPLWERYGNNPALEGSRVDGWPEEGDPIYENSPYEDSFVIEMILDGTLRPAGAGE